MNLWPYAAVSAIVVAFCAFLAWISPNSIPTAIAIASLVVGWWFQSPGEIVQKAMTLTQSAKPIEHVTVQKEQTNG